MQTFSKAILVVGGYREYCSYTLQLQNAVEINVTIFRLPSHFTHFFQASDEGIFGPLNIYLKNETAACKITRYRMARLIGFAWSTFASVNGCVSDFESTGMYPFNSNRLPEYLFSINDASESINSMETAPPSMAIVCVTSISVTISQILFLISPEPLSTTLSTIHSSGTSPEEITSSRLLIKISSIREILRRYSIQKSNSLFPQ
jgi:hypothetical protein